jgi:uncharacterized phage-associated protein
MQAETAEAASELFLHDLIWYALLWYILWHVNPLLDYAMEHG